MLERTDAITKGCYNEQDSVTNFVRSSTLHSIFILKLNTILRSCNFCSSLSAKLSETIQVSVRSVSSFCTVTKRCEQCDR